MSEARATVTFTVSIIRDLRPWLPVVLVRMTGPRNLNVWYLGVWRGCIKIR